jgi:hypothetical protein
MPTSLLDRGGPGAIHSTPVGYRGGRLTRHARPARAATPSPTKDPASTKTGSEPPGSAFPAAATRSKPGRHRVNRFPGGVHARGRGRRPRRRILKYAANTVARMASLILLGIFMTPPIGLTLAPPQQVGLRVCVPSTVTWGTATSAAHPARRGASVTCAHRALSDPSPQESGGPGRPPKPAAPGAVLRGPRPGICREARPPQPCPDPR